MRDKYINKVWLRFNNWMLEHRGGSLQTNKFRFDSKYLNVLLFPKILFDEYGKRAKLDDKWTLIDHAVREDVEALNLPKEFQQKPGKLIYFSLGSINNIDVEQIKRLLTIFSKSKHKFIISKGARHEEIELSDNMWGQAFVPQIKVLQMCDLFITHGGMNSFTEAMYFGVPVIVVPQAGDQHDTAQFVIELKLGTKINPHSASDEEIMKEIDSLLNDDKLKARLKRISENIQGSTSIADVSTRIEKIIDQKRRDKRSFQ